MSYTLQLLVNRAIQGWMIMPMDICPDGRVGIQVTLAVAIFQPRSVPGHQHQRLMGRRDPITHLRERMPDMVLVELDKRFGGVFHSVGMKVTGRADLRKEPGSFQ